ncbi:formimidoylglutamase [Bacillus sp. DJP31]|uniref:formimidoylglutamase n=1 Tax=Bacillus sp. DJP31 TaxID=3409789 RepID=UPI003BB6E8C0
MQYLKRAGTALFKDTHVTKANEIIENWDQSQIIVGIGLLGVPLSKSSISHSGAYLSPQAIRKCFSSFTTYSIEDDHDLRNYLLTDLGDIEMHVTDIKDSYSRIESTLTAILSKHNQMFPVILGGDHSITAPCLKAFAAAREGRIGVIQFDAHHDLRNLTDGGPTNGTPFRSLLESGTIKGDHLFQIGLRNFANAKDYTKFGRDNGVNIFTMDDIREKGIKTILENCLLELEGKVDSIYVSLDMDVMDQAFAPGCPAFGPDGMDVQMLKTAIKMISRHEKVVALDIVEIDPTLDFRDMTSRLAAFMILTLVSGLHRPKDDELPM